VKVVVNGEAWDLAAGASVADAVAAAGAAEAERGVAVAVEGEVVPRGEWAERILSEGEAIEVVHAVQGG
jgi:sulfur carrier protein